MKRKFIFVTDEKSNKLDVLSDFDFKNDPEVELHIAKNNKPNRMISNFLWKAYNSGRVNYYMPLPFHYKFSGINEIEIKDETEYYYIIFNCSFSQYDYHVWNTLKKKHSNVHLILIMWDSYDVRTFFGKMIRRNIKKIDFDYIFTFDLDDSKKYGFKYINEHYYSDKRSMIKKCEPKHDVYLVSRIKPGKQSIIVDLFRYLKNNEVNVEFELLLDKKQRNLFDGCDKSGLTILDRAKDYIDVIKELQSAKCIIEVLQSNQKAPSLRYYEAVMFNKKLLTNNPNVKDLNYYNPKYMKYFDRIEEIDVGWLKSDEKVDYKYRGDFSPKYLLEDIKRLYDKKID